MRKPARLSERTCYCLATVAHRVDGGGCCHIAHSFTLVGSNVNLVLAVGRETAWGGESIEGMVL